VHELDRSFGSVVETECRKPEKVAGGRLQQAKAL
jgi:hypothetical protein